MKFSKATILATALALIFQGGHADFLRRRTNAVCSGSQVQEWDCDIRSDVVGVYVCRQGATTCVDPSLTLATDTCGCCPGDNRPDCIDDGDGSSFLPGFMGSDEQMAPSFGSVAVGTVTSVSSTPTNATASATTPTAGTGTGHAGSSATITSVTVSTGTGTGAGAANGICSAFQIAEFDCDVADDVVGVYVCRGGVTRCSLLPNVLATDTCGCCPGDNSPDCMDDGDGWVTGVAGDDDV
jgi:hypothetical protein